MLLSLALTLLAGPYFLNLNAKPFQDYDPHQLFSRPRQDSPTMAIARPRLFTAISGTLGPVEFAQRGKTTIIRTRKKPKTKVTWRTIEAQRLLAYKISVWRYWTHNLSYYEQRWKDYTIQHPARNRLRQFHTLSPFQMFISLFTPHDYTENATIWPPTAFPQTGPPADDWVTITAPSTLIVSADWDLTNIYDPITIVTYSDPITPITHITKLRHHALPAYLYHWYQPHQKDYTAFCTKREISWTTGQQVIVTLIGSVGKFPRSTPYTYTVTVTAP